MFSFPINLALRDLPRRSGVMPQGEVAIEYVRTLGPILSWQCKILALLNAEQRARHCEPKNKGRKARVFDPGKIVIIRRPKQSNKALGVSGKLEFKATGPYMVIKQLNPGLYQVHKIPFLEGVGRPGQPSKAKAAWIERLPSMLCIYKQVDGADAGIVVSMVG